MHQASVFSVERCGLHCLITYDSADPLLALVLITGITATFKSYPSTADAAFFHTLLALYPELLPCKLASHSIEPELIACKDMRYPLLSSAALIYSICLLPTFSHLWLYAGSGNANFYYASTLVYSIATGALVADTLWAHLKRDFGKTTDIKHDDIVVIQR